MSDKDQQYYFPWSQGCLIFFLLQWMYIVPVVIFMMLTSQQPEQQEGSSQWSLHSPPSSPKKKSPWKSDTVAQGVKLIWRDHYICQSFPWFYLRLSCKQSYMYQFQTWILVANGTLNIGIYNCAALWLSWPSYVPRPVCKGRGITTK